MSVDFEQEKDVAVTVEAGVEVPVVDRDLVARLVGDGPWRRPPPRRPELTDKPV